jgi:ribosome-binding protein aMBF1 (putative translation factor)
MESNRPLPLFLPESQDQFTEHVSTHPEVWFRYYQMIYEYLEKYRNTQEELGEKVTLLQTCITDLEEQLNTANQDKVKLTSIIDFQKTQYNEQL